MAPDDARTRLLLPGRYDSNDFSPRCGGTISICVSDLCGCRRVHIFAPTASLETFREALALSRGCEAANLVIVHHGVMLDGDPSRTLASIGLQDGSTVHAFAREPTIYHGSAPAHRIRAASLDNSAAQPPRTIDGFISSVDRALSMQSTFSAWVSAV